MRGRLSDPWMIGSRSRRKLLPPVPIERTSKSENAIDDLGDAPRSYLKSSSRGAERGGSTRSSKEPHDLSHSCPSGAP